MRSVTSAAWAAAAIICSVACREAWAQEAPKWSDVDCAQSHIVGPAGLKCRATQVYSGGNSTASTSAGAGGQFQHWNMYGTVNKAKLFFFLKEAATANSSILPVALEAAVTGFPLVGKNARNFTATAPMGDGDYVRFTGVADDVCVAVRKNGSARSKGYRYYLLATKCVPKGQTISDADIGQLLASFSVRS